MNYLILHKRFFRTLGYSFFFLIVLFVLLYNQPYYPMTWIDEGFTLQGAINLLRHGQYAMASVEGYRILDQPLIANGPGIVLPLTLVFSLFGAGLLQARLLLVVFSILTIFILIGFEKRLYGQAAGLITVFFIFALSEDGYLVLSRTVIGAIPALCYFLAGLLLWYSSLKKPGLALSLAAGFFLGLSMITKGQYYILIPVMGVTGLLNAIYYKKASLGNFLGVLCSMLGTLGLWVLAQVLILGAGNIGAHLNGIISSSQVTVSALRPAQIPDNLWYLVHSGILFIIGPSIFYVGWLSRKRSGESLLQVFMVIFTSAWLVWYTFISIGWHRYVFEAYVVGSILSGKLVIDLVGFIRKNIPAIQSNRGLLYKIGGLTLLLAAMLAVTGFGFTRNVRNIVKTPDTSPEVFALYLKNHVSPTATIESWDWEIDDLTNLTYHHPSNQWVDRYTALIRYEEPLKQFYDFRLFHPDYLIDGPFSKWTGIYAGLIKNNCCTLIKRIGGFDLYLINQSK